MKRTRRPGRLAAVAAIALLLAAPAGGELVPSSQPARRPGGPARLDDVRIYLVLRDGVKLIGELAGYDRFVVRVRDQQGKIQAARWDQFLPSGCYHLQKRLTDPNSAEVNFRLGYYCWTNGLRQEAQDHFARAKRLDPSYADRVKQVCSGRFTGHVELAVALSDPKDLEELERQSDSGQGEPAGQKVDRPAELVKYQRYSPAVQARAVEKIRQYGQKVADKLDAALRTVESEHFILFTEWPAGEDRAMTDMFEGIYSRLCSQFDIPSDENIYLGKLPVFCWATREAFGECASQLTHHEVRPTTMAFVFGGYGGFQQMLLYRYGNKLMLEKIITHECVHTFVNRYRSNVPLEAWLNEGLAEVMAGTLVPRSRTIERARTNVAASIRTADIDPLLNGGYDVPKMEQYCQALTLVDYLLRKDPARFLAMIDKIKAGDATEAALKEAYGLDYAALAVAWRRWVTAGFPNRPN